MTDGLEKSDIQLVFAEDLEDLEQQVRRLRELVDALTVSQGELRLRLDAVWNRIERDAGQQLYGHLVVDGVPWTMTLHPWGQD